MRPESAGSRREPLQARSLLPDVQAIIRHGICCGTIRVVPAAGGGIRTIPTTDNRPCEALETSPPPCPGSIRPFTVRVRATERRAR
jgi:hypothetical protein